MIDLLTRAETIAKPWADLYNGSTPLQVAVTYAHLGSIVVSGGLAIAADRATLRIVRAAAEHRAYHLDELGAVHRPVLIGLSIIALSGLLLLGADLETYAPSPVFWTKMGLVALLLVNGVLLTRAERTLRRSGAADDSAWAPLRRRAICSIALWLTIVLVGTILPTLSTVSAR
jgi:hypothetical protein